MNHDLQVVPLDLSPRMGEPSKKQHRCESPILERGNIQIRADLFQARAYNNLHNESSQYHQLSGDDPRNLFWKMKYENLVVESKVQHLFIIFKFHIDHIKGPVTN